MSTLRIALAQVNLTVGDLVGNGKKIVSYALRARDELRAHAVVFPELALTAYPPEDLLLRPAFIARAEETLEEVALNVSGIDVILGHPHSVGGRLFNGASLLREGTVAATYHKHHLPNYGVFDERRYFAAGEHPCVVNIFGVDVGITVCEDLWLPGPVERSAAAGARLVVNLNASPFHLDKFEERLEAARQRVAAAGVPLLYANLVGGQDELVFDGESFVMDAQGTVTQRAPSFDESLFLVELRSDDVVVPMTGLRVAPYSEEESVYRALVLAVRDYIDKNGFGGAVLGLSGGVDSALTLAVAVDAIGAERLEAVMMPSRYTSSMSISDARTQAETMGVHYTIISIEPAFEALRASLAQEFAGLPDDVTEENMQARCRGALLMAISNKKHKIVLTTGNKSEMAVGYATLYGDMAGGFDVLKDVPKTLVYRLAAWRNTRSVVIPQRVIDRPPSAELAPGQKDTDSLPPYEILDPILERYVEMDESPEQIVTGGFDEATVQRVAGMVERNEYKRRQAAPGPRITRRAFGRDRRYPITNGFKG